MYSCFKSCFTQVLGLERVMQY